MPYDFVSITFANNNYKKTIKLFADVQKKENNNYNLVFDIYKVNEKTPSQNPKKTNKKPILTDIKIEYENQLEI